MKLDIEELCKGVEKEAGLGDLIRGATSLFSGGGGGNIMADLGNMATQILPIAMAFGAKKKAPTPTMPFFPKPNPLLSTPGNVGSFATISKTGEKKANFIDMGMLKTMLTMRAANGIVDTAQGKTQPQNTAQPMLKENPKHLELVSKYPEINKMLADPQSREYLESLLTKDTAYGS